MAWWVAWKILRYFQNISNFWYVRGKIACMDTVPSLFHGPDSWWVSSPIRSSDQPLMLGRWRFGMLWAAGICSLLYRPDGSSLVELCQADLACSRLSSTRSQLPGFQLPSRVCEVLPFLRAWQPFLHMPQAAKIDGLFSQGLVLAIGLLFRVTLCFLCQAL